MCRLKMLTPKVISTLPQMGLRLNQLLPRSLKINLIDGVLKQLFAEDAHNGDLDFLAGHTVLIEVTDFSFGFRLQLNERRLMVSASDGLADPEADLRVKASSVDFFLLCSAQVDPDTLFFQRRLSMIGDTELGLYLKNFLDAVDTRAKLPDAVWQTQQYIAKHLLSETKA